MAALQFILSVALAVGVFWGIFALIDKTKGKRNDSSESNRPPE